MRVFYASTKGAARIFNAKTAARARTSASGQSRRDISSAFPSATPTRAAAWTCPTATAGAGCGTAKFQQFAAAAASGAFNTNVPRAFATSSGTNAPASGTTGSGATPASPSGGTASAGIAGETAGSAAGGSGKSGTGVEGQDGGSSETPTGRGRRRRHETAAADDPGGGAPPPEEDAEPAESARGRAVFAVVFFGTIAAAGVVAMAQMGPADDGTADADDAAPLRLVKRAWRNTRAMWTSFSEPSSTQLLPEPLPEPYQPPYTLVISLDDLLVRSDWDPTHGWRVSKRPGVDFFLAYMAQFYEIVLFTSGMAHNADPVITKLDPFNYVTYRLYRDSCRYQDGKYVKDLACLNRDLSKVLIVDTERDAVVLQPENSILLAPWTGDSEDDTLLKMVDFLEALALFNVKDVRPAIKAYEGQSLPDAFAAWQAEQRRLRGEQRLARQEQRDADRSGYSLRALVARLFGRNVTAPSVADPRDASAIDYVDQVRQQMRAEFAARQADFQTAALQQLQKQREDVQQHMEHLKGSNASMWDWMTQGAPEPGAPSR